MNRIGVRQAHVVAPPAVAPGKQQRYRLHVGVHDQRSAVAAVTERPLPGSFDLNLTVEAQVSDVIVDDHVVEIERRDAPFGRSRGPTDLVHDIAFIDELWTDSRELSVFSIHQPGQYAGVIRDPLLNRSER